MSTTFGELMGSPVEDLLGYVSRADGGDLVFHISQVRLKNGKTFFVDGEHDMPYVGAQPDLSEELLTEAYRADPDNAEDIAAEEA
jgi:hypothetical protein